MDPLTLMALLSGGASIFGGLTAKDPFQQYLRQLQQFANPQQIGNDTQAFYRQFLNSPAFSAAQGQNIAGSNVVRNELASRLGASGMGGGGIGAAASSLGQSSLAPLMSRLYASGWQGAQRMASDLARLRVGGMGQGPAPYNMGGNVMGAGLSGLGDVLRAYLLHMSRGQPQSPAWQSGPQGSPGLYKDPSGTW